VPLPSPSSTSRRSWRATRKVTTTMNQMRLRWGRSNMDRTISMFVLRIDCKLQIYKKKTLLSIGYGLSHHIQLYRFCTQNSVGNFHEQVIPFLVSLYLHATFVSVKGACTCGWAWIFFRSYYGYVYKKGVPILFLSTIPAYCCVWYMIGGTIYGVSTMD